LKQSRHFRLLVSLGLNGSEVMDPPQPAQLQSPANFAFSPGVTGVAPSMPKSSDGIGSLATPASSGKSLGISSAGGADSGAGALDLLLFLLQQSRQVSPDSLRG